MQQTVGGLYIPDHVAYQDQGAEAALTRQYDGMAKLEKHFPRLVHLTLEIASALTARQSPRPGRWVAVRPAPPLKKFHERIAQ